MRVATAWHEASLRQLRDLLSTDPGVEALAVVGSGARGQFDDWSDLDALLVVRSEAFASFYPALDWFAPLGRLYASEQHPGEIASVSRVCFDDLRRLDLVVTTAAALARPEARSHLPLADGSRLLFSRISAVDAVLARPHAPPTPRVTDEAFDTLANGFWFKGTVAVQKVVRGDLLVALHLSLTMVQDCCVLAMMLRDRETGSTRHRDDAGNSVLAELEATRQPHTAAGILNGIARSSGAFDQLAARWSTDYRAHRHPLLAWVAAARRAVSATGRPTQPPNPGG
jgi:Streptomycin adenylyltransferase